LSPIPQTSRRPSRAAAALLVAALAGCVSAESPPPRPRVYEPVELIYTTSADALAAELGLRVKAEPATRTLALEGDIGRVVFVDGTSTIVVAGRTLHAAHPLRVEGGRLPLAKVDAEAVRAAWREAIAEAPAPPPSAPPPRGPSARAAAASGDPAWRVPLKRKWEGILLHHSATDSGNMAQFDKEHREVRGWLGVGYDFVINNGRGAPDGLVETTFRWKQQIQGAHAGAGQKRHNEHWVGICLVGNFNETRPTARQMASLRRLVRFLQDYCDIPDGNILGHKNVREGPTDCPGTRFPMHEILHDPPRAK